MASYSELIQNELAMTPETSPQLNPVKQCSRWSRKQAPTPSTTADTMSEIASEDSFVVDGSMVPPPPVAESSYERKLPAAKGKSFILQHYHATGCAGGAFSWRAASLNPEKNMFMCTDRREFRDTTMADIEYSLADKRRGGGPRVGSFQESIPGDAWQALPKYDFTTRNRSTAFNERMHVEWENHVDHILANNGELPTASVVAKAGFRSCAPCCRDMLALARPTGKTFIMVDLAEDDKRGTFHFVCGDKYLPVPKEALKGDQVDALKGVVMRAQNNMYASSQAIYDAVADLNVPIDETAQSLYLGDQALLPTGCASHVKGEALIEVLHAEHFARLPAEYGASILRDIQRPEQQKQAVRECRERAKQMLIAAWGRCLTDKTIDLQKYASAAVAPLLPEDPSGYMRMRNSKTVPSRRRLTANSLQAIDENSEATGSASIPMPSKKRADDDSASTVVDDNTSTVAGDDSFSDWEDPEEENM